MIKYILIFLLGFPIGLMAGHGKSATAIEGWERPTKIRIICIDSVNPINNLESTSRRSGENNEVLTQWSWCKEV